MASYSARKVGLLVSFVITVAVFLPVLLLVQGQVLYACTVMAAIAAAVLIFSPRHAFFLFLIALSFWVPQRFSQTFAVHPFDLCVAIVVLGMAADFLLKSRSEIRSALFDGPFVVLIIATVVSAVFAYNPRFSIVPCLRVVVIYLAFRAVFKFGLEVGVRKIALFYIYVVFCQSLVNTGTFLMVAGQGRVFGPPGLGFETFSMTALPMALAFMLWSERRRERFKFGLICIIIGLGILATQSRGPLLAIIIAIPVLIFITALKARREKAVAPLRNVKVTILAVSAAAVILIFFETTILAGAQTRYEQFIESLTNPQGTIALRILLWKTAIRTFLDFPLTGIGIGNFRLVHLIYPELKLTPLFYEVKGMSAHNVVLHYLAETGLVGSLALVVIAWKGMKTAYRALKEKLTGPDSQVAAALFIAMFVFCVTILYMRAWTWGQGGYVMALLFGLVAAWQRGRSSTAQAQTPATQD